MARSLMFKHLNKKRNKVKRKTVSCRTREGKLTLGFFVALLVCTMGFVYMSGVNNAATKGYEVESYEKKLSELKKEKQKMMIELADLKVARAFDSKDSGLIVINHKDVVYVTSTLNAVVMR